MKIVKEWKLGKDLHEKDNLLDGVTIEDLIITVHHNCRTITPEGVKYCFAEIMKMRLDDAIFIMEQNMDEIISRAAEGRSLQ